MIKLLCAGNDESIDDDDGIGSNDDADNNEDDSMDHTLNGCVSLILVIPWQL